MQRLEHIGIAVRNLDQSNEVFSKLLGKPHYKIETVESEGVRTSFFDVGGIKIELLEATREDSPISKFVEKRGQGIHHLAFAVDDIAEAVSEYQEKGFQAINPEPKQGADNKVICFLHPKSTEGVLVELCQEINMAPSSSR